MVEHAIASRGKPSASTPVATCVLQRKCACAGRTHMSGECEECSKKSLRRKAAGTGKVDAIPPIVHEVLRSSGEPLDATTRAFMEPRFGHDFSQVRVHTDARAAESARAVNALAYTVGRDVVFAANKYAPATQGGRGLLAHELAHTIQQRSMTGAPPSQAPDDAFESNAEAAERNVSSGRSLSRDLPSCGAGLARAPDDAREAAIKEAEALARAEEEEEEEEEEKKGAARGSETPKKFLPGGFAGAPGGFTKEDIYSESQAALNRIDEQIRKEREITKRPYKNRLYQARQQVRAKSGHWYSAREANARMTADEVWYEGLNSGLFVETEKRAVYKDHGAAQQLAREQLEEQIKQSRRQFEIKKYREHKARGEQLSSPAPFVQPFAFGAFGALVGAAYAGTQTGLTAGEVYKACAHGTEAECAAATAKGVAMTAGVRVATRGRAGPGMRDEPPAQPPALPPGGTTIKASPPPPPGRPPTRTIKASPPPPPSQPPAVTRPTPTIAAQSPPKVTEGEVVAQYGRNPGSVTTQSSAWHSQVWRDNGGSGPAPIAYRIGDQIRVDLERWLSSPRPSIGVQLKPGVTVPTSKPPATAAEKQALGTAETGKAPAPDPLAKTPPAAPPPAQKPPGPKTVTGSPESQQPMAPPARGGIRWSPKDPPQGVSPEMVERLRERARFTIDRDHHQQAWERLRGKGEAPPAFISEGNIYLDPSRWPPKPK